MEVRKRVANELLFYRELNMISILVMLNDYFHDFATAVVIVLSYTMMLLVRYVQKDIQKDSIAFLFAIYPKAVHISGGLVILLLMAGIVRAFTYSQYEWNQMVGNDQVWLIIVKHIVMFSVFGYGLYLWVKMHKVLKLMKER
ncbi:MAG: hypothetical protein A2X87_01415 [Deltaproteobacteria bacterium GWC2_42_51]|nr:MAG: hypothetical protein A2X87_01415 [Deltaproteobacteria bacterium GWC2_42_51]OGP39647.1 MAG: hypothetical protein A2090_01380 [Deltaproteobacteria bacterium GWD2_42_10]OGQ28745.1 MAG: hypothetical protein A3D29_06605 [Deltaproteobacteria bacterium RIFCSPHIGHO2_02_FULL_42_44]OGQ65086.1 MAG: hypothetical protein A3F88_00710 [Deltaproteobacteria bacterium RIFCSPLOWO2_12_FULL_42_16]OGQ72641.1 MAG: hypothetical protein A2235_12330 [Deltaproteobacteria bacterium RIFOXYA2_FULL_42_10]